MWTVRYWCEKIAFNEFLIFTIDNGFLPYACNKILHGFAFLFIMSHGQLTLQNQIKKTFLRHLSLTKYHAENYFFTSRHLGWDSPSFSVSVFSSNKLFQWKSASQYGPKMLSILCFNFFLSRCNFFGHSVI
jgi:hypothetical protein